MSDIGEQRKAEFFRLADVAFDGGPVGIARRLTDACHPISMDISDVVNRYGKLGRPFVAVGMELTAAALLADMPAESIAFYHVLKEHMGCVTVPVPVRDSADGEPEMDGN